MIKNSCILINALELDVVLGWPEAERQQTQKIFLDIRLRFSEPVAAEQTDDLNDTVCYDTLISQLKTFIHERSFRLLEYFAAEIYQQIKKLLPPSVLLTFRVSKNPAIAQLTGGVTFCYGDEEAVW